MKVQGTWGIGSFKIPDLGITEAFIPGVASSGKASWLNNPNVYKEIGTTPQQYANTISTNQSYSQYQQGKGFNPYGPTTTSSRVPQTQQQQGGGGGGGNKDTSPPNPETTYVYDPNLGIMRKLGDIQREAAEREARVRGQIESGFGEYENRLRGMESDIATREQDEKKLTEKAYEDILSGLSEQKRLGIEKLGVGRQEVGARKAQSIEDLKRNLADTVKAMSFQLGALGAGDTSASTVMMPYAYTKLGGVEGGKIERQANEQLFEIDKQMKDLESKYSELWTQTETEKTNALQRVGEYYGGLLQNIRSQLANAPREKAQALATLETSLLNQAQARLAQIEAFDMQRKASLEDWAKNRMEQLNNMKLQLQGTANFSPRDIVFDELKPVNSLSATRGVEADYSNPAYLSSLAKKIREDYLNTVA